MTYNCLSLWGLTVLLTFKSLPASDITQARTISLTFLSLSLWAAEIQFRRECFYKWLLQNTWNYSSRDQNCLFWSTSVICQVNMTLTILAKTIKLKCQTYMDNRIIAIIISQQVLFFSTKLHPLSSQMIQRQWTSSWLFASFSRWCLHISFVPPPPASRPHCPCRSIPPRCLLGSENASSPLRYTWLGLLFFMEMKSADPLLS